MKLARLESTTQRPNTESAERARQAANTPVRRVEAMEGVHPDRERSLQQEMAEMQPMALAEFEGRERIREDAHAVADQIAHLEGPVDSLVKLPARAAWWSHVDDQA